MSRPYLQLDTLDKQGKPLAIVRGGKHDGSIIYLCEGENDNQEDHIDNKAMALVDKIIQRKLKENATDNKMRQLNRNADTLRRVFKNNKTVKDPKLKKILEEVRNEYANQKDQHIKIPDGELEIIPNMQTRECGYAAAPSGSGKSYWTMKYAKQYNKIFPKNNVVLFSKVDEDPSLKGIKNLIKIPLDEDLVDDPIEPDELKNSLVIFDDTDTIRDKEIKKEIDSLKEDLLETGRHNDIYVLITSHLISNYRETRTILNESHLITVFPSSGSRYQIQYVLGRYFGLSPQNFKTLFHLNSRWVTVKKNFPVTIIYDKGCYLLSSDV